MFSFFRKSKKDTENVKRNPYQQQNESDNRMYKNNNSDIVPDITKNITNATLLVDDEKINETNTQLASSSVNKMSTKKDVNRGGNVKPCGHGTTAIAPWVPNFSAKRENSSTPPSSPVLDVKKQCKNGQDVQQSEVTASMKLHINLPQNETDNLMTYVHLYYCGPLWTV